MRSIKSWKAYVIILTMAGLIFLLASLSSPDSRITAPQRLPALSYLSKAGLKQLRFSDDYYILVVLISDKCGVCVDQLNSYDRDFYVHPQLNIVFLTTDLKFLIDHRADDWANLSRHRQIVFGIVKRDDFRKAFGTLITPSYYLFDRKGLRIWAAMGKVSFTKINKLVPSGNSIKN